MKLIYTGPDPARVGCVPVPEGWTAADHDEPDAARAALKLASGLYRRERPERAPRGGADQEEV